MGKFSQKQIALGRTDGLASILSVLLDKHSRVKAELNATLQNCHQQKRQARKRN